MLLTADHVEQMHLPTTTSREGYEKSSVDAYLEEIVATLRAWETEEDGAAPDYVLHSGDVTGAAFPTIPAAHDEGYDMAIGSRYVSGVNVVNWPMGRVLMSYFASKYVRLVTGFSVHDTTAGFVCYRRRVLETIPLDEVRFKGYGFQIEMKYTAYKIGFKIKEVPVVFVNRREGVSKMSGSIFGEAFFGVMQLRLDGWLRKYPTPKA